MSLFFLFKWINCGNIYTRLDTLDQGFCCMVKTVRYNICVLEHIEKNICKINMTFIHQLVILPKFNMII